jgi:apolipoprotein N-acyltransferase
VSPRELLPTRRVLLATAATAALLFVAYPPAGLAVPAFVALVPFLWMLEEVRQRGGGGWEAARTGYWFGVVANGTVLYWMVVALWHFTPLSALGYLASVFLVLAPVWLAVGWATWHVRSRTGLPLWLVFPLVWTAGEWLQGHTADLRFPWLGLGTALVRVPTLVQWADLAGARGVTLWLAWANALVFVALFTRRWRHPALALALTLAAALGYGFWRERTLVMRPVTTVAVLQPNVGYDEKRRGRENDALVQQLLDMTRRAHADTVVRLVAWPEVAVPNYFVNVPEWERWIGDLARELRTPILAGGLDAEFAGDGSYEYFNAAFLFDTTGSARTWPAYRKTYLVPIVERVPFLNPRWFGRLQWFGGYARGHRFPVYRIAEGGFGVLICYESAFEDLARHYRRDGADFLVNITNDAWFGRTAAPYQHAGHLVMRAIETRVGVARSANTGISQFLDPLGRTSRSTPLLVARIERAPVLTTDVRTVYVRLGDWVAALALIGSAALLVAAWSRRPPQGAIL